MKSFILILLSGYHLIISPLVRQLLGNPSLCRFSVPCSVYAKEVISKYGIIHGVKLTIIRLAHCQPLSKSYANL